MFVLLPVLYGAVYLTVSGSVVFGEWVYAVAASIAAAGLTVAVRRMAGVDQRFRSRWFSHLLGPVAAIVTEMWPLTHALARALRQRRRIAADICHRPFDPGHSESAEDRARRALVTIAISLSPSSLVLERDIDCRELTIAGVAAAEPAIHDRRWPL